MSCLGTVREEALSRIVVETHSAPRSTETSLFFATRRSSKSVYEDQSSIHTALNEGDALFSLTQSRREDTSVNTGRPPGLVLQGIAPEVSTIRGPGEWLLTSRPSRAIDADRNRAFLLVSARLP
jgi:hypothetical protein